MKNKRARNLVISLFVIFWTLLFHYESVRYFYLNPLFKTSLPKTKFLFPPAGWIMFFRVDDQFSHAEVFGVKDGKHQMIEPHKIILNRFIGFDNVHRNVLSTVLSNRHQKPFCQYLNKYFPEFDSFYITAVKVPSVTKRPFDKYRTLMYKCE